MRFLPRLLLHCVSWVKRVLSKGPFGTHSEDHSAPYVLAPGELVTRFIYSKSQIRKEKARPKPAAFNPSPHNELSVVHSSGLSKHEIWELGKLTRGTEPGRSEIFCKIDAPVQTFNDVELRALRDDKPFIRHTSIIDWPIGSDANDAKALWKEICLKLSQDPRVSVAFQMASTGPS